MLCEVEAHDIFIGHVGLKGKTLRSASLAIRPLFCCQCELEVEAHRRNRTRKESFKSCGKCYPRTFPQPVSFRNFFLSLESHDVCNALWAKEESCTSGGKDKINTSMHDLFGRFFFLILAECQYHASTRKASEVRDHDIYGLLSQRLSLPLEVTSRPATFGSIALGQQDASRVVHNRGRQPPLGGCIQPPRAVEL
jgi:hypothetical protein